MAQPDESQEKTPKTDAVLMHPGNDPKRNTAQVPPPDQQGQVLVEQDGEMVPADQDD